MKDAAAELLKSGGSRKQVIGHLPADKLTTQCWVGGEDRSTQEFLIKAYLSQLRHHLGQIGIAG